MRSTMMVPPTRVPMLIPTTVTRAKLDGRRAWRTRIRRSEMPLALATMMYSERSVMIISLRSSRANTASWPAARVTIGKRIDNGVATTPLPMWNQVACPVAGSHWSLTAKR